MAVQRVLLVLVLLYVKLSGSAATQRYVQSTTSTTCPAEPCLTLSDYVNNTTEYFTSDTSFIFLEGEHYLNTPLLLNNITNITLRGNDMKVRIIISPEAGISCINSLEISLGLLKVVYYGRIENLPKSTLLFNNSYSIRIVDVEFIGITTNKNHSRALSFIQSSTVHIANCSFFNGYSEYGGAIYLDSSTLTTSGVNIYINNTAEVSGGAIFASNNSMLIFSDTNTFKRNKGTTLLTNSATGGGAIFILRTHVEFNGFSTFEENGPIAEEVFLTGGAIKVYESMLTIRDRAVFIKNSGTYSGSINGFNSTVSLEGYMTFKDNRYGGIISLFRSNFSCIGEMNFTDNEISAPEGFGAVIFSENSTILLSGKINFTNNVARNGVGGAIFTFNTMILCQGDIYFINNVAFGGIGGAICVDKSILECQGSITFANNSAEYRGGGVYAIDSTVAVSGTSSYLENTAVEGGGMGFEGTAQLVLRSPITMTFDRNRAESIGGALLFLDSNAIAQCQNISVERKNCFFKIEAENTTSADIHLNFTQNSAINAGTVLYGGSLQLCRVQVNNVQVDMDSFQFLHSISTFYLGEDTSSYISSDPLRVCFCNNGVADCSEVNIRTIFVKRGELFPLSLITVGQGDMPVPSTIRAYIRNNDDTTELTPQSHMINKTCTDVGFRLYTEDVNKTLILYPDGPCGNTDNTRKKKHIILNPCPPGFDLEGRRCLCERRLLALNNENECNIDTALIERPGNTWIRPTWDENNSYNGFILHPDCPLGYCRPASERILLDFTNNATNGECSVNRSGILCGACKQNHSLTLHNFHCIICENKYISLLLFFGFAGVALIVILLTLHMTVAAGTINGLILYANIVNVNGIIFLPHDRTNILTIFIAWLNLDFGIQTCFYDGLDFYSYAWLEYAFPLYLWFLIGAIIFSNKLSAKIGKLFGSNPIAVLATVILMSYTKLLQTTILALSYTYLEYPDGTMKKVWLFDANITYFEGKHIILAIVALCVIVFLLLPYIFLLMFGYRLQAYSGKRMFLWFNKFKPLLDAYYAPYNKKTRYWTGFMLFVRGCLFLNFSFNALSNDSIILVAISSVFTAIAIIPWLSNRIYEMLYIDILEASFILNICILSSATYHVKSVNGNQAVVTYLSIGVAFVEFVGVVIFHIYIRIKDTNVFLFFKSGKFIKHANETLKKLQTKSLHETVKFKTMAPFTTSVVELREPLLED